MSLSKENKVIIDGQTYYGGLNQPPKFVKVNVDCWEKIFDYLSLRDIVSMSQTCQRMRQISGYYFRENFDGTKCWLDADSGPVIGPYNGKVKLERDDFLRFVDTAYIFRDLKHLKHYSSLDLLGSLTTLTLYRVELNANAIDNFEKSLRDNIETVQLINCKVLNDFDGQLLTSCPKLNRLIIYHSSYTSDTTEHNLLRYTYPTVKHLECIGFHAQASVFTSFLERNSSIKSLHISAGHLLDIASDYHIDTSSVQLDCLTIEVDRTVIEAVELANLLKKLHANGFYKKLHLSLASNNDGVFINEMRSFGALEALNTFDFFANICHLTELKELHLFELGSAVDLESIAMNLTKLERLWIPGTADELIPFLRNSKALKLVIWSDRHGSHNVLNLFELNRVRYESGSRRKVLIGAFEEDYLATKWKSKKLKYDLVEITRVETIKRCFVLQ